MSEQAGRFGAVWRADNVIDVNTISFTAPNLILDSADGFVAAGFVDDEKITISTISGTNDGDFTIFNPGVGAGQITVVGSGITTETAADAGEVVVATSARGTQLLGFSNWTIDGITADLSEITNFEDGVDGYKKYLATLKDWTASAERFWKTDAVYDSLLGENNMFRLFIKYVAVPSGGDPSYYYEGIGKMSDFDVDVPVGEVIKQTLSIQGNGAISFITRTSAWLD